jgi:diaminohydroxyphosphoribosylaminopyrimidine deaminase/5-amino-6-(5-phosphoribosylamino)uracil reductase
MLERSPVRVVLDARLRIPLATAIVGTARETPTWVFAASSASAMAEEILRAKGVEVVRVEARDGSLGLTAVLRKLAERGITRLMVEGGPTVAAAFVQADLVDEAALFRSPNPIGADGIDALEGLPLTALTQSPRLKQIASESVDGDRLENYGRV